jgi:hypothetical protein
LIGDYVGGKSAGKSYDELHKVTPQMMDTIIKRHRN